MNRGIESEVFRKYSYYADPANYSCVSVGTEDGILKVQVQAVGSGTYGPVDRQAKHVIDAVTEYVGQLSSKAAKKVTKTKLGDGAIFLLFR